MLGFEEIKSHFDVVQDHGDYVMCRCPCNENHKNGDKKPSLRIKKFSASDINIKCFCGCPVSGILERAGLKYGDVTSKKNGIPSISDGLFQYAKNQAIRDGFDPDGLEVSAIYDWTDLEGSYVYSRVKVSGTKDGKPDKTFRMVWIDYTTGNYQTSGINTNKAPLYHFGRIVQAIRDGHTILFVEGEKDVETLEQLGYYATTTGSSTSWRKGLDKYFTGADVVILPDNDAPGKKYLSEVSETLSPVTKSLRYTFTSEAPGGDVTDYLAEGHEKKDLGVLILNAKVIDKSCGSNSKGHNLELVTLDKIEEKEARWIIPGWIPRGQITSLCGDGGVGKSFLWCSILAALTNDRLPDFMFPNMPFDIDKNDSERPFLMFSGEDSTATVLKKRLRKANANQARLLSLGAEDERFSDIEFTSDLTAELIEKYRPIICIFDPVQSFVPTNLRMAERNAMRSCTQKLIQLGEAYDCTFIIVVHSNKRQGAYGRNRMADSSDLWDASRSVIMAGQTQEKDIFYLSHEKTNYGTLEDTILYQINNGVIKHAGTTEKKDRDFIQESIHQAEAIRPAPARDEAIEHIRETLKDGELETKELDSILKALGISVSAIRKAKEKLKKENAITFRQESKGKGKGVQWFISLTDNAFGWEDDVTAPED